MSFSKHLRPLLSIIYKHCHNISFLQATSQLHIEQKPDRTFVTNLDKELNTRLESEISEYIRKEGLNARIVAEESWKITIQNEFQCKTGNDCNTSSVKDLKYDLVFYIDPIDGTAAFIDGREDWCIMCGLCDSGIPVLGIVWSPRMDSLWFASKGEGAHKMNNYQYESWYDSYQNDVSVPLPGQSIHIQELSDYSQAIALRSTSRPLKEMDQFFEIENITKTKSLASMGIKCCLIAEGKAHVYVNRCCSYWDSAGPRIILEEAGGVMCCLDKTIVRYEGITAVHDYMQVSGIPSLTHKVCDFLSSKSLKKM